MIATVAFRLPRLPRIDRRSFLMSAAALAAAVRSAGAQGGTKLILLGTGGGPRPRKASSGSAQVIVSNGLAYVIDCGDGVARQMAFAGVPLPSIRHVFITHQHSDHTADYGNLILAGVDGRAQHTGRHVGATAARADDKAVLRDERV